MIKTTRQLEDIELRDLITNLENKVILQVSRSAPGKVTNIISIQMKVISILLLDRIIPRKEQHKIKSARVKNFKRPNSTITTNQQPTDI